MILLGVDESGLELTGTDDRDEGAHYRISVNIFEDFSRFREQGQSILSKVSKTSTSRIISRIKSAIPLF